MRIGIDIDGVLTDIEKWQFEVGSKYLGKYIKNPNEYNIRDIFEISSELENKFWDDLFLEYIKTESPRRYASEVINKLKEEKNEIYILTARYLEDGNTGEGSKIRNIVTTWLNENGIYFDELIFTPEHKLQACKKYCIDIMIEDNPDNVNDISNIIPVMCFNAHYNEKCIGKNIFRVYSWYDLFEKIKNLI